MESRRGFHLLIVASALLWGSSFPLIKVTLDYVNPYFLTAVRMAIAGAIGLTFVMSFSRAAIFKAKAIWVLAGLNALGYGLQHIGMQFALASESSLLINVNVIFVAILAAYVLGEKLTMRKVLALALGVAGILILASKGDLSFFASEELLGQGILVASGFSWAVFIVLMKRLLDTHGIVEISMAVVAETALILSPPLAFSPPTGIALEGWAGILYLAVVCTAFALFVYLVGLRRVGATTSSVLLVAEVLFAIILSILFLQERITTPLVAGGLLVLLAIILVSLNGETTPP
jgi:drug/metabolite transporter (DMT)-like permease